MPAMLEAEPIVIPKSSAKISEGRLRSLANLRPPFQPGHAPLRGAGRPKGSRDALNVILDAAPIKARQYVKSTAPAVLVDARKWIMPIDSDAPSPSLSVNLVAFLEAHTLPATGGRVPLTRSQPATLAATSETEPVKALSATTPATGNETPTPPLG